MGACAMAVAGAPEEWAHPASIRQRCSAAKLEGDLVIHLVALEAGRRLAGAAATAAAKSAALTAAATAIQHGQFAAEILQHHFGGIFLGAVLVGPFAGLELALDIDLGAFLEIFLGYIGEVLVEDHHAMPLGLFLLFAAGLVAPAFGSGDRQIDHRIARRQAAHL